MDHTGFFWPLENRRVKTVHGTRRRRCEASEVSGVRMPSTRINVVIHSNASPTTILSNAVTLITENRNVSTADIPTTITSRVVTTLRTSGGSGSANCV